MTQSQTSSTRSALSTGRWIALVVVLAGLLGMHGLAGHGTHGTGMGMTGMDDQMVTMASTTVTAVSAGSGPGSAMPPDLPAQVAPTAETVSGPTGVASGALSGGEMFMLCLAVLTAGALLLRVLLRRPRVALVHVPAPQPFAVLGAGRAPDPPSLTGLSLRRC
jgi:hypothetical protein